jgi:26S proteasome regulatory subunit T1
MPSLSAWSLPQPFESGYLTVYLVFPGRYVPVHIEYVLVEILKNAFRATVENHQRKYGGSPTKPMPPVVATIALASLPPSPSQASFPSSPMDALAPAPPTPLTIGTAPQYLTIRIRDQGGGVHLNDLPRIFSYAFTTARGSGTGPYDDEGMGGGPYAAQYVGGAAGAVDDSESASGLFSEITSKGLQTGLGTLAGLGYG